MDFLIELSIFDFSSNFTGPDLQKFSAFELLRSMLVQSKKVPNPAKIDLDFIKMVSITLEGLWMVSDRIVDFRFSSNFTGPDLQKFSVFELLRSMLVINQKRFLIQPRLI